MGVSGCLYSCVDSVFKDIGLIGSGKGWMFYVGGKGGVKLRIVDRIVFCILEEKIYDLIEKVI